MIKNRFLLFILIFISANSVAQIPGYMGKRFTIGYSTMFSPNIVGLTNSPVDPPVLTHVFNLGYVVTKQKELCVSVRYSKRGMHLVTGYYGSPTPPIITLEKFTSFDFSLGWKRFSRAKFAPLGSYSRWELAYTKAWINYGPYEADQYDGSTGLSNTVSMSGGKVDFIGFGASYSRGRQRIFKDKFMVDFGFKGTLMGVRNNGIKNRHEDDLQSLVIGSLNFNPIFNLYIGIGFLAF
jgi:hypothetical protein